MLASAGIKPVTPAKVQVAPVQSSQRIRMLLNDSSTSHNVEHHIGLVTNTDSEDTHIANPANWVTFNSLDGT